jgi:hypothetical protein
MAPDEAPPPPSSPLAPDQPAWNGWWLASDGRWYPPWMAPGPLPPWYGPPGYVPHGYEWPSPYAPSPYVALQATHPGTHVGGPVPPTDPFAPSSKMSRTGLVIVVCIVAALFVATTVGTIAAVRTQATDTTYAPSLPAATLPPSTLPLPMPAPYTTVLPASGSGLSKTVELGQRITLPPAANGGVASITVVTFRAPYANPAPNPNVYSPPSVGYEYAVAEVRECAGAAALPSGPNDDNWGLEIASGEVGVYDDDVVRPGLDQFLYVAPHHCVQGSISFLIASGAKSIALTYVGSTTVTWRLR